MTYFWMLSSPRERERQQTSWRFYSVITKYSDVTLIQPHTGCVSTVKVTMETEVENVIKHPLDTHVEVTF